MRTIVHFFRLDLSSRLLLAVMAPVLVLGVLSVWLADRHEAKFSHAQARQTIELLSAHVVRSIKEHQSVNTILPSDERTSLVYVSTDEATTGSGELLASDDFEEAVRRWRGTDGPATQPIVFTQVLESATGPVLRALLPIDRSAAIADGDDPSSITHSGRTLEGVAILETSMQPISSAWWAFREQLVLAGLAVGFLALLFGRTYAVHVIATPVEELRCRLGDAVGEEHSLLQPLRLKRWDEIGDLSKDLERVRVQLLSDFKESQHALGSCSDSNTRAIQAYEQSMQAFCTLMDAAEDATMQTEKLHVCAQHARQHLGRLSTLRRELGSLQQQTSNALEPVLASSSHVEGAMRELQSKARELDLSINRCGSLEEKIRDSAESLDVLATNLGLLASRQPDDTALREFAAQAGALQEQYRHEADDLHVCMQGITEQRSDLLLAAEASQSLMARLGGSTERAGSLVRKQSDASESLVEILGVIQNTLQTVEQSAGLILTRLEHVHEISSQIGNTTSQSARLAQRQGRLLEDASNAVGRYTVEDRAKAA